MAQTLPSLVFKPEPSRYVPTKAAANEEFPSKDRWDTSGSHTAHPLHASSQRQPDLSVIRLWRPSETPLFPPLQTPTTVIRLHSLISTIFKGR